MPSPAQAAFAALFSGMTAAFGHVRTALARTTTTALSGRSATQTRDIRRWRTTPAAIPRRRFAGIIAIGFVVSFVSGWIVIKVMLDVVNRYGLAPFGWWRIVVGAGGLALLTFG